jgi:hypothetical protein
MITDGPAFGRIIIWTVAADTQIANISIFTEQRDITFHLIPHIFLPNRYLLDLIGHLPTSFDAVTFVI